MSTATPNPLCLAGIEFIEYSTRRPQALGQVLETMGFRPIARHRSREVLLYRQGEMNIIVNAHEASAAEPAISAIALRVQDAAAAFARVTARGGWPLPIQVALMELNIPAIRGVGNSRIYFVDRHAEFSIYDVDFVPIPGVDHLPPALAGLRWFGLVQYIGADRLHDWAEWYRELFGFEDVPDDTRFGILPNGRILQSPCGHFYLQLVEPEPGREADDAELLQRVGLGARDVLAAAAQLRARGVTFVEALSQGNGASRGAITDTWLDSVRFELVHDER
jgi:4-hydroxyphenylpyruvate dioxygenase